MKMIRSTRSTSIIGVTLMSACSEPPLETPMAISVVLVFGFKTASLLGNRVDHAHARLPRDLDGLLHPRERHVGVRLQIQNLVDRPAGVHVGQLILQLVFRNEPHAGVDRKSTRLNS